MNLLTCTNALLIQISSIEWNCAVLKDKETNRINDTLLITMSNE